MKPSFGSRQRFISQTVTVSMREPFVNCETLSLPTRNRLKGLGMITSPKAVRFDEDTLWVSLSDGRTIAAPLAWFPRLLEATPEQRAQVELSKAGLHWEALDEDISVAGLLAGQPDLSRRPNHQPA